MPDFTPSAAQPPGESVEVIASEIETLTSREERDAWIHSARQDPETVAGSLVSLVDQLEVTVKKMGRARAAVAAAKIATQLLRYLPLGDRIVEATSDDPVKTIIEIRRAIYGKSSSNAYFSDDYLAPTGELSTMGSIYINSYLAEAMVKLEIDTEFKDESIHSNDSEFASEANFLNSVLFDKLFIAPPTGQATAGFLNEIGSLPLTNLPPEEILVQLNDVVAQTSSEHTIRPRRSDDFLVSWNKYLFRDEEPHSTKAIGLAMVIRSIRCETGDFTDVMRRIVSEVRKLEDDAEYAVVMKELEPKFMDYLREISESGESTAGTVRLALDVLGTMPAPDPTSEVDESSVDDRSSSVSSSRPSDSVDGSQSGGADASVHSTRLPQSRRLEGAVSSSESESAGSILGQIVGAVREILSTLPASDETAELQSQFDEQKLRLRRA